MNDEEEIEVEDGVLEVGDKSKLPQSMQIVEFVPPSPADPHRVGQVSPTLIADPSFIPRLQPSVLLAPARDCGLYGSDTRWPDCWGLSWRRISLKEHGGPRSRVNRRRTGLSTCEGFQSDRISHQTTASLRLFRRKGVRNKFSARVCFRA